MSRPAGLVIASAALLALLGAVAAQLFFARLHDRQIEALAPVGEDR
jgi:hypothetical protein